jgi:hypothetical protein
MAERRLWVCCLPRGHRGQCFAPRYDVERAFWEGWELPLEEAETEREYLLRTYGPEGTEKIAAIVPPAPRKKPDPPAPVYEGRRRRARDRDKVYAGFIHDGVKSAVSWHGRKVREHPTLDQLDQGHLVWK